MPAVSISFCKCSNKSGHYQLSVFVAEAAVPCAIHNWILLGKKSPRNRFLFVKDCTMFPKIVQDSLSKHLAAVRGQVSELLLHRQNSALSWAQFYEDAHAVWHVQGELARRFLFSEAWGAYRAWVVCRARLSWLPAQCRLRLGHGSSGAQRGGMPASSSLSTALFFNKACPRQY